jgi:predicted RNA-binding protein with PIN domain
MIIIVDAYNLLRATPPYKKTITEKERMQFIAQLSAYGRRKGHKIVIVFDGGPYEWPFKENMKVVQIVYSGIHESADDYIKEYVQIHKAKDLLLVSSDNELNRYAEHLHIPSIDSSTFSQLVYEEFSQKASSAKKQEEIIKLIQDKEFQESAQDILDRLMMEASKNVAEKSEDFYTARKTRDSKKEHMSKQDRVLLEKLKKL